MTNFKGIMWKRKGCLIWLGFWISCIVHAEGVRASGSGPLVKKDERWPVVSNEYGEISAVRISDGINGSYLLHFFALEPHSLLLPVVLNADMVFYVHAGSGRLSWTQENVLRHTDIKQGDVYRLVQGSVFYIHSYAEQQRLKIHAIFPNSDDDLREPATGPYSSIQDTVLAFDKRILQATFKVSEEAIDELLGGTKPPAITRMDNFSIGYLEKSKDKEKKKAELFNLFEEKKMIENCNGWSTIVTQKQLPALEGSHIGLFVVNLTAGSMMEPHWNTVDTEVVVVLEGRGMVRVSSPSISKERAGGEMRLEVEQGDVFVVPKFRPSAQMAFNNGSFVLMGFTRMMKRNSAQFIAGKSSVLQVLGKDVLELSFNVRRTTLDELLAAREDSVISACISCAEEEMQIMKERGSGDEGEARRHRGGDEEEAGWQREREEAERHYGGDEEETAWRREREEAERHYGGDEEEAGWRRGGDEDEAGRRQRGEQEMKAQRQNHYYVQGVRRILKRN